MSPSAVDFIPPVLLPSAKKLVRTTRRVLGDSRGGWQYVPEGWRAAPTVGWADPSVVETQKRKWPQFVAAVSGTGMLGVAHEMPTIATDVVPHHNVVMTFAYVIARAAAARPRLSVLDWGGGLGHYAVIARSVLPEVAFDYTVKDLPHLCQAGREVLPEVKFVTEDESWAGNRFDLIVASGSLQYEEMWGDMLRRFAEASNQWVYITRIPIVEHAASHVIVQRPHHVGYNTEYISWVLNRGEFLNGAEDAGLTLVREFIMETGLLADGAPEEFRWGGFLFTVAAKTGGYCGER
jgi:putative methyltransferase (TIGR04325 family)